MMGEIRPLPMKKGKTSLKIVRNRHFSRNLEPYAEKNRLGRISARLGVFRSEVP